MATRTVRLDPEAERTLRQILEATGLPISEALKRGLRALETEVREDRSQTPYAVYSTLDFGKGGYAKAPSTDVKRGVKQAIRRKLRK
jgi:hypothetical protein